MSVVRVNLGGGNFADLEPDLYAVDRELLADLEPRPEPEPVEPARCPVCGGLNPGDSSHVRHAEA